MEIPFFFLGTPSGHDMEFHLYSWLEVAAQWKQEIFLPRWASLANFGYGEPRFVFYPPASWTLGAVLTAVFPWSIVSGLYIWITLSLAGVSMFTVARRWFSRRDAMFAAVFYVVNPYHLVIVYWRSAFAELLASCLVPLLLLLVWMAAEGKREWSTVPWLAVLLAAAWLSNAPVAVMIHYSLALLVLMVAWQKRSTRLLVMAAAAVVLGACLAAFYLIPAIYEQRWVNIAEAVSAGSRPIDNFLFVHTGDAEHDAFNRLISWVATFEIVAVLAAGLAAFKRRSELAWKLGKPLGGWAMACTILMFPVTALAWSHLPKLQFMQFPWRWLLCLSMMFAFFLTAGVSRWWLRIAVYAVAVLLIAVAWQRIQAPWWDQAADLREMHDNVGDRIGYEGVDEYTPVGADPSVIDKDARYATVDGPARAAIRVTEWKVESKVFTAEMSAADRLAVKLFPYPAWRVEVNGHDVPITARTGSGQMLVPVAAGMNQVKISFRRTWDRSVGGWISVIACCGFAAWYLRRRRLRVS